MIRHIVLFQWSEGASTEDKELTLAALREVRHELPMLSAHYAGPNVAGRGRYDFAATSDFETADDLQAFVAHPAMRRIHEILMRTTKSFEMLDFTFSQDPALNGSLLESHTSS